LKIPANGDNSLQQETKEKRKFDANPSCNGLYEIAGVLRVMGASKRNRKGMPVSELLLNR